MAAASASLLVAMLLLVSPHTLGWAALYVHGGLALGIVLLSWLLLHTVFALRYAHPFYNTGKGGPLLA